MKEEEKTKIRNRISAISLIALAIIVVACFLSANGKIIPKTVWTVMLGSFMLFYWILTDYIEPKLLHAMDDMSKEKKENYMKWAGIDLAGYIALFWFVRNVGSSNTTAITSGIIYLFCLNMKRKIKEEFYHE